MGAWLGNNGYNLTGIAQKQKNAGADAFFKAQREKSGASILLEKNPLIKCIMS